MGTITRDMVEAVNDIAIEEVKIPEWGPDATVYVRSLNASERGELEEEIAEEGRDMKDILPLVVIFSAVDAEGNKIFTKDDVDMLKSKNAKAVGRIFTVAKRLSGLLDQAELEEQAKN